MIKIAIADDETKVSFEISQHIQRYFEEKSVSCAIETFTSGTDLLEQTESFDLIFLDIRMNGLSGIETAKRLRQNGAKGFLVFITALQEYVYDAFEVDASDYLLKPIDMSRFTRTMDRLYHGIRNTDIGSLVLPSRGNTYQSILFRDIYYLEAMNHKIQIYTRTATYEGHFKIANMNRLLDSRFFQCHRSYFVNLDYVCGYENLLARLSNGKQIPVSRLRGYEFSQAVLGYMKGKGAL